MKLNDKILKRMLEHGRLEELRRQLDKADPADVADILEDLDSEIRDQVFAMLDTDLASEVIVEMEPGDAEEVVENLSPDQIADIIDEMAPDDAADFFNDLESDDQTAVLPLITPEKRVKLDELLNYEEDSAGGLMTPELCALSATATVTEAINTIAHTTFSDPISVVFVVDKYQKLVGCIGISELLAKPRDDKMGEVVEPDPICAEVDEDQEEVANRFRKYDLLVMPVIDEDNKLVGRITVDDVMDVLHEEASEDLAHIAGAPDLERNENSPMKIARLRLPWLMVTMFTGMIISVIIQKMTGLTEIEALAAFVPVIMAMGGNTGMQSSAVTIRNIALGEIELGKLMEIFGREVMVGVLMGLVCGLIAAFVVWFNLSFFTVDLKVSIMKLAIIVSVSMCVAMTFASLAGTMLPIFLHRFKIDPALASGPFVTTGNDLSASLIYFFMCYFLLQA